MNKRIRCTLINWNGLLLIRLLAVCLPGCGALIGLTGCGESRNAVRARLETHWSPAQNPRTLEIRAQVSGPTADLVYKWFAESGECEPQQSSWPATTFKFAEDTVVDHVRLEIWSGGKRVAATETEVKLTEARLAAVRAKPPNVTIEITQIPLSARGGEHTRDDIAGRVSGEISADMRVVVYAQAGGVWYLQPTFKAMHAIGPDNTWRTWTHSGRNYAALLVRREYLPLLIVDALPGEDNDVLARVVVEGRKP